MTKTITVDQAIQLSNKLNQEGKTIVLVGGCFDILHSGHKTFLEQAKKRGDALFVLLESDEAIKKQKGKNRPINAQKNRAMVLATLKSVDYIALLPFLKTDLEYDRLVITLKPGIIATTAGDTGRKHKERQAQQINARVVDVTERLPDKSTTRLVNRLESI